MRRVTIFCDGLCEPTSSGGIGISAAVAFDGDVGGYAGALRPAPLVEAHQEIGRGAGMTNNIAEYKAVRWALRWAVKNAADADIHIFTDSMLVVNQVNGSWQCNKEHLRELRDECRGLMKEIAHVSLEWVRREENDVADALTDKATEKHCCVSHSERTDDDFRFLSRFFSR